MMHMSLQPASNIASMEVQDAYAANCDSQVHMFCDSQSGVHECRSIAYQPYTCVACSFRVMGCVAVHCSRVTNIPILFRYKQCMKK